MGDRRQHTIEERASRHGTGGCLIVLDSQGPVREIIPGHGINGPWDMTAVGKGRTPTCSSPTC